MEKLRTAHDKKIKQSKKEQTFIFIINDKNDKMIFFERSNLKTLRGVLNANKNYINRFSGLFEKEREPDNKIVVKETFYPESGKIVDIVVYETTMQEFLLEDK